VGPQTYMVTRLGSAGANGSFRRVNVFVSWIFMRGGF